MAEQDRMTKAERREQRRLERIEEEAAAKVAASRARVRNALVGVVSVAAIGGLVALAVGNGTVDLANAVTLTVAEGEAAQAAAGCEVLSTSALSDRTHYEPNTIPVAETIYTEGRPTNSGPHYSRTNGVIGGVADTPLAEEATTHNLEHGAVIVWFDPDQVDGSDVDAIDDWLNTFNDSGFAQANTGAGLFASPYEEPGIDSGKAIAVRAWGVSMDCDTWDETALNAFVIDHYGTNGIAPENSLGPYPAEVLAYSDVEAEEQAPEVDPSDIGTMAPTEPSGSEASE
jgi:hypothetical protein